MAGTSSRLRLLVWLAPVCGVIAAVVSYRTTYESEAGLYAGAEPGLAGAVVAAPFVTLALAQVGCAVGTVGDPSARRRDVWVGLCLLLALTSVVGTLAVLRA